MFNPIAIPKVINDVVNSMELTVKFKHGTWLHLMSLLVDEKTSTKAIKNSMYPLIMLIHDFEERRNNGFLTVNLDLIIVQSSDPNYSYSERYDINYLPTLYPLYKEFMTCLMQNENILTNGVQVPNHTKIDALNMGVNDNNGKISYQLPDYLDGLIIRGLELSMNENEC